MATQEQKYNVSVRYVIQWILVEGCCWRTKCLKRAAGIRSDPSNANGRTLNTTRLRVAHIRQWVSLIRHLAFRETVVVVGVGQQNDISPPPPSPPPSQYGKPKWPCISGTEASVSHHVGRWQHFSLGFVVLITITILKQIKKLQWLKSRWRIVSGFYSLQFQM